MGLGWIESIPKGLIFANSSRKTGYELWISDDKGTRLLKDIYPGPGWSNPSSILTVGGITYFSANDGVHGEELWRTDGTPEGTRMHIDLMPGPESSGPSPRLGVGGKVYFYSADVGDATLFATDSSGSPPVPINPLRENHDWPGQRIFDMRHAISIGNEAYFMSSENEIWKSDGTTAGTVKVAALGFAYQEGYSIPTVKVIGDKLFFRVNNSNPALRGLWVWTPGASSAEKLIPLDSDTWWDAGMTSLDSRLFTIDESDLIVSDGTVAGTRKLKSVNAWLPPGSPEAFAWKGNVYFQVCLPDDLSGELWKSDGTEQGTVLVKEIHPTTERGSLINFQSAGDYLYFRESFEEDSRLWRTDGTAEGTVELLPGTSFGAPYQDPLLVAHDDQIYFAVPGSPMASLWTSAGTPRTTRRLTRPSAVNESFFESEESHCIMTDGRRLFLLSQTYEPEAELWQSDGTAAGTRQFWSGKGTHLGRGTMLGSRAIYEGDQCLLITNGTARGTKVLKDLAEEGIPGFFHDFLTVGGLTYSVLQGNGTQTLWKTDGTPAGTVEVRAAAGSLPAIHSLTQLDGVLYFLSQDGNLWRSDGSSEGTWMVKNLSLETGEGATDLMRVGNRLNFSTGTHSQRTVWVSDGTEAGTVSLGTIPGIIGLPADLDGVFIFAAKVADESRLYRCDESSITHFATLPEDFEVVWNLRATHQGYAVTGGNLFFGCGPRIKDLSPAQELWKTDGTAQGTALVKEIRQGELMGSDLSDMLAVGNEIFFTANDGIHGVELWQSDGTEEGTVLVADIEPGNMDSYPRNLTVFKSKLYFSANNSRVGRELFSLPLPKKKSK